MTKTEKTPSQQSTEGAQGTAGSSGQAVDNAQILAALESMNQRMDQIQNTVTTVGKQGGEVRVAVDRLAEDRKAVNERLAQMETGYQPAGQTETTGNEQLLAELRKTSRQDAREEALVVGNALIDQYGLDKTRAESQMSDAFSGVNQWAVGEGSDVLSQDLIDNCSERARQMLTDMGTPPTPKAVYHALKTQGQLADRQATSDSDKGGQQLAADSAAAAASIQNSGGSAPVDTSAQAARGDPNELGSPAEFDTFVKKVYSDRGIDPKK